MLSISFTYFWYYENMLHKITPQCKILNAPEEGWFCQQKCSTPSKKLFYVMSLSAFILLTGSLLAG